LQPAATPSNEAARIAALENYDVLDSLPEQAYDDITHIASQICDTPIALVSLVDSGRQWFKSKVGLDADETPRDVAFCAHAILKPDELFVVENASEDDRFADNPLVAQDPAIRFYAGAPLVTEDGNALGTLCVIDRTPRELTAEQEKTMRALARQVMALLELRLSVRDLNEAALELEQTNHELARSNRDLERFAYVAAHDLKEPLRMISSFTDVLSESLGDRMNDDEREYFNFITDGAERGQRLTSEILMYSKLEQESERTWVDLDELLDAESKHAQQACPHVQVLWEEGSGDVWGNSGLVEHLLHNLIGNGLKYNAQERPVVMVKVEETDHGRELRITDNGVGIRNDSLDKIFDMFYRAHDRGSYEGTGIGLAICRRVMELHGGTIRVESQEGHGSTFTCTFPTHEKSEVDDGSHQHLAG
jgi:signal transduction histidine kinase